MNILCSIVTKYLKNIDINKIALDTGIDIERVYYKLALIQKLENKRSPIILHQRIEEDIKINEIIDIMKLASDNSILILEESCRESNILNILIDNDIYNGVFEDDIDTEYIISLLNNKRSREQALDYYCIESDILQNDEVSKDKKNEPLIDNKACIKNKIKSLFKK